MSISRRILIFLDYFFQWMNFVMNRGRSLVVIIGNSETLKVNENWNKIIEFCMQC